MKQTWLSAGVVLVGFSGLCQAADWREKFKKELPLLGHRNWIVIADSAYPAQSRAGIETIATDADHLEVIKEVLAILDKAPHVRPVVYSDAELKYVPEQDAPGINALREELGKVLGKGEVKTLPHDEVIAKLDKAGQTFRVVILKTKLTLPYTSVFLELDCRYWSEEAETKLRAAIKAGK